MYSKHAYWLLAVGIALFAWAHDGGAQTQTRPTTTPPTDAAASGEDEPGSEGAGEQQAGQGQQQNRQRRRIQTTTTATLKIGDKSINLLAAILKADSPDYRTISGLKDGDVLALTRSQAIKLKTDLPMTFGDLTLKTENVAKGYAGVYSIWLKKTAGGWNFIFNEKPDVWGTMYDPAANVGEIPVEHGAPEKPTEALTFALEQQGDGGTLKITWGEHQWSAKFTLGQ